MNALKRNSGQFVPFAAMAMFTMVIFLIAVVNVYTVSRAKLKVQNLADAAALNLASQQAQAYNLVADKNEWLNHMMKDVPSPNDSGASAEYKDCSAFDGVIGAGKPLPGISCVENDLPIGNGDVGRLVSRRAPVLKRHVFWSRDGAINYAMVIRTVNQAQKLFVQAYNSFLGAEAGGTQSGNAAPRNFTALLKEDIPDLQDPSIRLVAWNSANGESAARQQTDSWENQPPDGLAMQAHMAPLEFKVDHDIPVRFYLSNGSKIEARTFSQLLYDCVDWRTGDSEYGRCGPMHATGEPKEPVGWMKPVENARLRVNNTHRTGVGVRVEKKVPLPVLGRSKIVHAEAKAYIVEGTGANFKPTYWVKLGN
ncbi:MAG: hypothetical protein A2992_01135 [Elusimicrobia bacterium RIFCSPLOWO2_01_FULL_59_12]|nr:MAG: hypothetical protein A2992_01135 [Elusimicrobia bacterium RIFCSPLOWO2_01_FULL_59_12]